MITNIAQVLRRALGSTMWSTWGGVMSAGGQTRSVIHYHTADDLVPRARARGEESFRLAVILKFRVCLRGWSAAPTRLSRNLGTIPDLDNLSGPLKT